MTLRKLKWGLMAAPLLLAAMQGGAFAAASGQKIMVENHEQVAVLSGVFGARPDQQQTRTPNIHLAQAGDPRLMSLEEEVRSLNGKIEELNFLILQMQEQQRKQQEDNDFRFEELEKSGGKRTDAGHSDKTNVASSEAASSSQQAPVAAAPKSSADDVASVIGSAGDLSSSKPAVDDSSSINIGSIKFDDKGNLIGSGTGQPVDLLPGADSTSVAALPTTDDPDELYRNSYEFILASDFKSAEAGFRSYIERFPTQGRIADANFWLGESLAGQKRHRDAAEVFLATSRDYPDSKKAPDTLLKLGMSLSAMKQREVACATFREIDTRYPNSSGALKERVKQELTANSC